MSLLLDKSRYHKTGRVLGNPPPVNWFIERAREGTHITHAMHMMREEGYTMSNSTFRVFYKSALHLINNHETR